MQPPKTHIDPAAAVDESWRYVVALRVDDWDQRTTTEELVRYNGRRRAGRWNLRDLGGAPVGWDYADEEILILEELGTSSESGRH